MYIIRNRERNTRNEVKSLWKFAEPSLYIIYIIYIVKTLRGHEFTEWYERVQQQLNEAVITIIVINRQSITGRIKRYECYDNTTHTYYNIYIDIKLRRTRNSGKRWRSACGVQYCMYVYLP